MAEETRPGHSKEVKHESEKLHVDEASLNSRLDVPVAVIFVRRLKETGRVFVEVRKARSSRLFLLAGGAGESITGA